MNIPEEAAHHEGKKDAVATHPFIMCRQTGLADNDHANKIP
jgi:hypothetical protein